MNCPKNLIPAFTIFNSKNDYQCVINKISGDSIFTKANQPSLKIDSLGRMNEAAQKRFKLFLDIWFRLGKDFIVRLKSQAIMLKVA